MATMKLDEAFTYSRNAGADLSEKLHYLAKIDTDGDIVLAGDGQAICGVIYEAADENYPCTVMFGSIGKALAGGTITAGDKLASNGNGEAVLATTGEHAFGVALTGANSGEIVSFIFNWPGRVA